MQDLSFSFPTPHFQLGGFEFSVLIYTFRNVYAPDEAQMTVEQPGDTLWAGGKGLRWAGGQMEMPGRFEVRACICSHGIRVKTTAEIQNPGEDIRCIKVIIHGIPDGKLVNLINAQPREIPQEGLNLKYPDGWRDVGTPLVVMQTPENEMFYFRSLDEKVRDKRFVFVRTGDKLNAELILKKRQSR